MRVINIVGTAQHGGITGEVGTVSVAGTVSCRRSQSLSENSRCSGSEFSRGLPSFLTSAGAEHQAVEGGLGQVGKLSDSAINHLTVGGFWRYQCGGIRDA